jgi:hypothetical protein
MPFGGSLRSQPLEYFILYDTKPGGHCMGLYGGQKISSQVTDAFGREYVYAGIAPRKWNGQLDVGALRTGEFILMPGLVYRLRHVKPTWFESLFRTQ